MAVTRAARLREEAALGIKIENDCVELAAYRRVDDSTSNDEDDIPYQCQQINSNPPAWQRDCSLLSLSPLSSFEYDCSGMSLKPPRFIEGDDALRVFPIQLWNQIRDYCRSHHVKKPSCIVRDFSQQTSHLFPPRATPRPFINPNSGEALLGARFEVGRHEQILVIQQSPGTSFMNGRAVVIHGHASKLSNIQRWHVWNPSCRPTMCTAVRTKLSRRGIQAVPRAIFRRQKTRCSPTPPPSPRSNMPLWRRRNLAVIETETQSSRPKIKRSARGTKRKKLTIAKDRNSTSAILQNYQDLIKQGQPLVQKPSMPTAGSASNVDFVFRNTLRGPDRRRRAFTECDTSRKLFVQAICAGIIKPGQLVLKATLGDHNGIYLMKDDLADFMCLAYAVQTAQGSVGHDKLEVVITSVEE